MGNLGRWLKKLTSDDAELEADALTEEADACGAEHADGCRKGQRVTLQGRLRYVDLHPDEAQAALTAELYDGTDSVKLIWLGRRSISGIEPGRTMRVRGRVAVQDGQKIIYNPDYDLMPVHA
jgi:RecG-like helicase